MNELLRRLLFLPPQGSTVARSVDTLHYFVILTTFGGAFVVTAVGGWFLIRYRRREGYVPDPLVRPPMLLEWLAVVSLAGVFLAWWRIGSHQFVHLRVAPRDSLDIYVTAKQWMWQFAYPRGQHAIGDLVVPKGRPVRLVLTSRDVIHSFYVPGFRVKQDAVPGRFTTLWFEAVQEGTFPIFCAEYCGAGHSTMRGSVKVVSEPEFERWLSGTPQRKLPIAGPVYREPAVPDEAAPAEPVSLAREGQRIASAQGCLRCHTVDGAPHIGPTWAGLLGATIPLRGGGSIVADDAYITESMMDPRAKVHAGFSPVMPSFQGRLDAAEVAAIVEFIRTLKDTPVLPGGRDTQLDTFAGDAGIELPAVEEEP